MKGADTISTLLRSSDPRQLRRAGNIARFFAALLILTLVARGTAGATMPTVTVQTAGSGTVSKSVITSGTIQYAGGTPFTVPSGLLVTGVPVQEGQSVKAGDVLATFDAGELDRAIAAKKAELYQVQVQAAQQAEGDSADPYSAQLAQEQLERAYEETHTTYADGQESIERARQDRDEAAQAVENARNAPLDENLPAADAEAQKQANIESATATLEAAEEALYQAEKAAEQANKAALSAAQNAEDSRNTALHALEKEEETVAEQNELARAEAAVSEAKAATLQAELDALLALQQAGACLTAPQSGTLVELALKVGETSPAVGGLLAEENADFTISVALSAAQNAEDSRNTALHALEKEEETVAEQNELARAEAAVSEAKAATLQAELDALLALQQAGACLTAPQSGTLVELALKVGETSPAVGGLLAEENADFTISVVLTEEQAQQITVGTVLHVSQNKATGDAAVQNTSEADGDGNVTVTATLPEGNWAAGAASVTATAQSARQELVLPATAVRHDSAGDYVLAVEEKSTILGLQNQLVRLPVTVVDQGDSMAAVSGPLDYQTQVVTGSDKPVQAGDKVRLSDDT